jgi:hypothetical protein
LDSSKVKMALNYFQITLLYFEVVGFITYISRRQ